jgi:hypothetical protein
MRVRMTSSITTITITIIIINLRHHHHQQKEQEQGNTGAKRQRKREVFWPGEERPEPELACGRFVAGHGLERRMLALFLHLSNVGVWFVAGCMNPEQGKQNMARFSSSAAVHISQSTGDQTRRRSDQNRTEQSRTEQIRTEQIGAEEKRREENRGEEKRREQRRREEKRTE